MLCTVTRWIASALLWAHRRVSRCRGTRYLLLCALDGRKSGRVTVGESRLPVAGVLRSIRAVGTAQAALMWPQLSDEELSVLEQLAADIPAEDRPEVDVLRADLVDAFQGWAGSAEQAAGRVIAVLAEHGVIEGDGRG